MSSDKDLQSIEQARQLVERAYEAQKIARYVLSGKS